MRHKSLEDLIRDLIAILAAVLLWLVLFCSITIFIPSAPVRPLRLTTLRPVPQHLMVS